MIWIPYPLFVEDRAAHTLRPYMQTEGSKAGTAHQGEATIELCFQISQFILTNGLIELKDLCDCSPAVIEAARIEFMRSRS